MERKISQLVDELEIFLAADLAADLLDLHRAGLGQLDADLVLQRRFRIVQESCASILCFNFDNVDNCVVCVVCVACVACDTDLFHAFLRLGVSRPDTGEDLASIQGVSLNQVI